MNIQAQVNIMGKPGYMTTPSADWMEGKPLGFTFSYVPNEYSLFKSALDKNTINFYNVRASLTSFMEVNLSIAYRPEISDKIGVGDRQLDFRFRLLKEKEIWPSIVLGWTPPGSRLPILAHDYLVLTKNVQAIGGNWKFSAGFGSPYVFTRKGNEDNTFWKSLKVQDRKEIYGNDYLYGFFSAVSYSPFKYGGLMLEYDSKTLNAGAYFALKDWLYLQAYTFEGKKIGFTTSLNFSLDFGPKTLRRYEKDLD
ncbi:YjbH domain-containing protein [Gillisia sp. CAL575]|uniref:YjbH domain-containing protein n=1 Tax=Gillisia sp. CAL575 TaxID=985255 RepID=UPI0003A167D7|nr:YjbH domain-containing protein [Gillisia sp. CAL575]